MSKLCKKYRFEVKDAIFPPIPQWVVLARNLFSKIGARNFYLPYCSVKIYIYIYFFLIVFALGGSPTPHPISSRPHFVCKFSRHGSSSPVTSHLAPSIMVLVFPYSADAYSRITASYRLHNFLGQIPESSQILGASKLPLLE